MLPLSLLAERVESHALLYVLGMVLGHRDDFTVAICDHNMQGSESCEFVANSAASYPDWDINWFISWMLSFLPNDFWDGISNKAGYFLPSLFKDIILSHS
jgi:hypothetical protein